MPVRPSRTRHVAESAAGIADRRPGSAAQRRSPWQDAGDGSRRVAQLDAYGSMVRRSPGSARLEALQGMADRANPSRATIQRKEKQELQEGVFNMIGETHTDYPNENARMYESRQIRRAMGEGVKYFTENMLKTTVDDTDYADPIHLRLEQIIAFAKEHCAILIPKLKDFSNVSLEEQSKQETVLNQDAGKIIDEIIEMLKGDQSAEEVAKTIRGRNYDYSIMSKLLDIYDRLEESDDDDDDQQLVDTENDKEISTSNTGTNLNEKIEQFVRQLSGKSGQETLDDGSNDAITEDPVEDTVEDESVKTAIKEQLQNNPVEMGRSLIQQVAKFRELFADRLPGTLLLYHNMKRTGQYSEMEHFMFSQEAVAPSITAWKAIEAWENDANRRQVGSEFITHLHDMIAEGHGNLVTLVDQLDKGMEQKSQRPAADVTMERSKAMHNAASTLKGEKIVWKVGDLHIGDIKKLESEDQITTEYAYMQKDVFNEKYLNMGEMEKHQGLESDVDRSYGETQKQLGEVMSGERRILKVY